MISKTKTPISSYLAAVAVITASGCIAFCAFAEALFRTLLLGHSAERQMGEE
jgi:hypothetical protein